MNKKLVLLIIPLALVSSIALLKTKHIDFTVGVEAVDTYTINDFSNYLEDKKEHYPLSDEFIERYQQASGGYIDYAKQCGIVVDRYQHSPNQKWHYFTSWLGQSDYTGEEDAKQRIYNGLKCPELLLWIFEAMGAPTNKIKAAKEVAEVGRVNNTNVSTIAANMRKCVLWDDVIINLK